MAEFDQALLIDIDCWVVPSKFHFHTRCSKKVPHSTPHQRLASTHTTSHCHFGASLNQSIQTIATTPDSEMNWHVQYLVRTITWICSASFFVQTRNLHDGPLNSGNITAVKTKVVTGLRQGGGKFVVCWSAGDVLRQIGITT